MANILIFMNVHDQSNIMSELIQEGHVITKEQAACLAPYLHYPKILFPIAREALGLLRSTIPTFIDIRHEIDSDSLVMGE